MMKRLFALFFIFCLLLSGCAVPPEPQQQYTATFLTLFDTVTTIIGRGTSEEDFTAKAQAIHDDLLYYHQLFDIYKDYEGLHNLKTINDNAGIQPVKVDKTLLTFLSDCKDYYAITQGRVNVAMGSVLRLWHDTRDRGIRDPQNAVLPSLEDLSIAKDHTSMDSILLDWEASTVYITDPETSLDVGAVAKGWATQRAAENAPAGMLISVGGNVCATGPKTADGTPWVIGIQDPDTPDKNLHTLYVPGGCVVTSGDYQRTYMVDGVYYHHIIDPETLMPGNFWRSVSVLCEDAGLADALSTGLFLMDREQGEQIARQYGAEVLWVDAQGQEFMTDGFTEKLRN